MSQAPCTLFCPRSGLTPTPSRPMLPVSMARLAMPITMVDALAVLGDAKAVIDCAIAAGGKQAGGGAHVGCGHASEAFSWPPANYAPGQ